MVYTCSSWCGHRLAVLEKKSWFNGLFVQKKPGEIKKSLLILFLMFAAVSAVAWGIFGKPYAAATAILMWGTGDAAAALFGIPFGKHKVLLKPVDGKKSWEGTAAMLLVSLICGLAVFVIYCHFPFWKSLAPIFVGAIIGAATELFSPSEYDTVTVPVVVLAVLLLLSA